MVRSRRYPFSNSLHTDHRFETVPDELGEGLRRS